LAAGYTIVEAMVVCVLLTAVLALTLGSVTAVHRANRYEDAKLRQEVSHRELLRVLGAELRASSLELDASTNEFRYRFVDPRTFAFSKLEDVVVDGDNVRQAWSSEITIRLDQQGRVLRQQDSDTRILATGVRTLSLTAEPHRFTLTATLSVRDPRSGLTQLLADVAHVVPLN
jgi:hypothetical protein